jgi:hypothetical protein
LGSIILFFIEKLPQGSKTGIRLLLTTARTVVQIFTASAAEAFAIFTTQKLRVHIQYEYGTHDVFQVSAVAI